MAIETSGRGRAALVEGDVEFDSRDAALLQAIARTGSIATAASELGRSRARALRRLDALEEAFGTIVDRQRGGSGGGGTSLTDGGVELLDRYQRLESALAATARVPETVLRGTVTAVEGELAIVDTAVGTLQGLHEDLTVDEVVQARIGADAVTLQDPATAPESDATSARNRCRARVTDIESGKTVREVALDTDGVEFRTLVTDESAERLDLRAGQEVVLTWKATATRLVSAARSET